jgi:hypothetical protein
MNVPDNVYQALNDAKASWEKLSVAGPQNKARWSDEQLKSLALQLDLVKHTYNALYRLIKANE